MLRGGGLRPLQALLCAATGAAGASLVFLGVVVKRRRRAAAADPRHHVTPELVDGGRATLARPHWRRFEGFSRHSVPGGGYVWRLVLTGGPCGGRSAAIKHLSRELRRRGVDVYAVPEAPTTLINGGCRPPPVFGGYSEHDAGAAAPQPAARAGGGDDAAGAPRAPAARVVMDQLAAFETGLLQLQLQLERSFVKIAQATGRPAVVVMDRGLLDVAAYLPQDGAKWREILRDLDFDEAYLLGRYDMVLHLTTAADGAAAHFPDARLYNDAAVARADADVAARASLLERARALDGRLARAWERHPNRHVVTNDAPGFDHKLSAVLAHVSSLVQPPGRAGIL